MGKIGVYHEVFLPRAEKERDLHNRVADREGINFVCLQKTHTHTYTTLQPSRLEQVSPGKSLVLELPFRRRPIPTGPSIAASSRDGLPGWVPEG